MLRVWMQLSVQALTHDPNPQENTMLLHYRNVPYELNQSSVEMTGSNTFARFRGTTYLIHRPVRGSKPQPSIQLKFRGTVYETQSL
jgi:hypothetical protein